MGERESTNSIYIDFSLQRGVAQGSVKVASYELLVSEHSTCLINHAHINSLTNHRTVPAQQKEQSLAHSSIENQLEELHIWECVREQTSHFSECTHPAG